MRAEELANISVGYFCNYYDKVSKQARLYDCLKTIPENLINDFVRLRGISDQDIQKEEKKKFPMFTPSAICGFDENGEGTRKHDYVIQKNNIMAIDIDKQDNEMVDMNYLKQALFRLPYVYAVSYSIRGNGLFMIIAIEDVNDLVKHFKALENEYRASGIVIDKACKDLTRGRYISYDPGVLIKTEGDIIPYAKKHEEIQMLRVRPVYQGSNDLVYDDIFVYKTISKIIDYGYSSDDYSQWLVDAFRLGTLGSLGEDLFLLLSKNSQGYKSERECLTKFKDAERHTNFTREDAMRYYFSIAKKKFGDGWITKIRDNKI